MIKVGILFIGNYVTLLKAEDVKRTIDTAIKKAKLKSKNKPKLLSDNGPFMYLMN